MDTNDCFIIRPVSVMESGAFTRATTGTYLDAAGVLQTAAIDAPRWDHTQLTLAPKGLLVEPAATQLLLKTTLLNDLTYWPTGASLGSFFTAAADALTAPDGTSGATGKVMKFVAVGGFGLFARQALLSATAVAAYAASCWIYVPSGQGVSNWTLNCDLQDVDIGPGSALQTTFDKWVRVSDLLTSTGARTFLDFNIITNSGNPAAGFTLYFFGPQLEAGSAATSYIANTSTISTLTRAADICTATFLSTVGEPATVTDADPAVWNAATNYATGAQVTRPTTHMIYQRIGVGGVDATTPEADVAGTALKWVKVGPTNRWKMFDNATNTQTTAANEISVMISPTTWVDSIAFDNVDADYIRVRVDGSTYDQTINLKTRECLNYYQFFFEPFRQRTAAVFTGLPLLVGNRIQVSIYRGTGTAKVGACSLGLSKVIGKTQYGASLGIVDYTVKSTDSFGVTSIVERPYSKRQSVQVLIDNNRLDEIFTILSTYRAKPVVYATAGNLYSSMIAVGFYKSFDIVVEYYANSKINLEIEGLT